MHQFGKETVIATFRVRAGQEAPFQRLALKHGPTLQSLGFTNGEPSLLFRGKEKGGGTLFVEVFTWKDRSSVDTAHEHPEVAAIWEAMEPLLEARDGHPKWEFPHVEPVVASRDARA